MPSYLYRLSSGQCVGMAVEPTGFGAVDTTYFGIVTDPPTPDGADLVPTKVHDNGTVRLATQPEIDGFQAAEDADKNLQQRDTAKTTIDALSSPLGKALRATTTLTLDELNILRTWLRDFQAVVAASNNLAQLQSGVAGLSSLPDRTLSQAKTAILNTIDGGSVD